MLIGQLRHHLLLVVAQLLTADARDQMHKTIQYNWISEIGEQPKETIFLLLGYFFHLILHVHLIIYPQISLEKCVCWSEVSVGWHILFYKCQFMREVHVFCAYEAFIHLAPGEGWRLLVFGGQKASRWRQDQLAVRQSQQQDGHITQCPQAGTGLRRDWTELRESAGGRFSQSISGCWLVCFSDE